MNKNDKWKKVVDEWVTPSRSRHEQEDILFMSDVEAAIRKSGQRFAYILSIMTAVAFFSFLVWAKFAILDEVTRGDGQVIPSSRIQVIQNLEGGIVSEMLVNTGEIVEKGQVLLRIDNSTAESTFEESQSRYNHLIGMIARLEAEIEGKPLSFSEQLKEKAPDIVADQTEQFEINKQQKQAQIQVLQSQANQRSQEVKEMRSRLQQLENNLSILREEYNMTAPLVTSGAMSRVDLLRIQGQVTDLEGEISTIKYSIPRAQSAASEAVQKINEAKATMNAEASKELASARAEAESISKTLTAGEDKVSRTQVRSPVRGTVKEMMVNTVGGVIKPGEDIMEIVPLDDTLLVEARVKPTDIAFIRPDQKAVVKITAYDFSIYGGLEGKVEQISADTIQDEEGNSFYRVQVRTNETSLAHKGEVLPIIPGMTATVEILTGHKSVLDYILKPILKAQQNALRER